MAEGAGNVSFIDTRQFAYFSTKSKIALTIALSIFLVVPGACIFYSLARHESGEFIVFYLSIFQTSFLAALLCLFLGLSGRDANRKNLSTLVDKFYDPYLVESLSAISIPAKLIPKYQITTEKSDIFGKIIHLTPANTTDPSLVEAYSFRMWVGLNVYKFIVIYFIPVSEEFSYQKIQEIFKHSVGGQKQSDFNLHFEETNIDGEELVSLWYSINANADLLTDPNAKLYWAQDIAMGTESIIRTAVRNHLPIFSVKATPGPL